MISLLIILALLWLAMQALVSLAMALVWIGELLEPVDHRLRELAARPSRDRLWRRQAAEIVEWKKRLDAKYDRHIS